MARPMPEPAPVTIAILLSGAIEGEPPHPALSPKGRGEIERPLSPPPSPPSGERVALRASPLASSGEARAETMRGRVSDRHCVAVAARICSAHQCAGFRIARDALPTAHDPGPVVDHVDLVAALHEAGPRGLGNARLGVQQAIAVDAHAWLLDGFLDVEAEFEDVEQHLRLRLQDAVGTRSTHAQH